MDYQERVCTSILIKTKIIKWTINFIVDKKNMDRFCLKEKDNALIWVTKILCTCKLLVQRLKLALRQLRTAANDKSLFDGEEI